MSTTKMNRAEAHAEDRRRTTVSSRGGRERKQPLRFGTFADGQRVSPVTVIYSADVGSFGDGELK